jgi:hypothetical protein
MREHKVAVTEERLAATLLSDLAMCLPGTTADRAGT